MEDCHGCVSNIVEGANSLGRVGAHMAGAQGEGVAKQGGEGGFHVWVWQRHFCGKRGCHFVRLCRRRDNFLEMEGDL